VPCAASPLWCRHKEVSQADRGSLDSMARPGPEVATGWPNQPRRIETHFTPTSSSWLNLGERCFALITDRRLRRGVFGSVIELTKAIRLRV